MVELHIVPMINPDGVIIGNSRVNLGGVDLNRKWGEKVVNEQLAPESFMCKEYIKRFKGRTLMFLDFHGHTR